MKFAVALFVAVAIVCCASADNVSTSLLLPNGLFDFDQSFKPPTFVGQVTVITSATYYTLDCFAGGAATYFDPGDLCSDGSYTFSEMSASTQYLFDTFATAVGAGAASDPTDDLLQTSTINCSPLGTSGSATCTTTYTDGVDDTSTDSVLDPIYTTNIESSLYPVFFSIAADYSATSSTASASAKPSPTSPAPTAKSTTTSSPKSSSTATSHPFLGASSKVGIGLGVPLGACALASLALLLYRHGKHKERSRMSQMQNLAPPGGFASEAEGKRLSEAGVAGQKIGRQPPVYSMEMQG